MSQTIEISSVNFNGQSVDVTFYPCSGGSINLGTQIVPFQYTNDNYEGTYDIYISAYTKTCQLVINCPTLTPTPTNTNTPTPSITPTLTPTPTTTSGPAFDPDAAAYLADVISAGGSVDATMSAATNTLFTDLKSNSLYSKLIAFYPILGGVQASHSINGNLNATYNINFNGAWTHSVSGQTSPNGGYGLTNYIIPSGDTSGASRNLAWGVYVNTSTNTYSGFEIDFGVRNNSGSGSGIWRIDAEWTAQNNSNAYHGADNQATEVSPPKGVGFYVATRLLNVGKLFFNGTLQASSTPSINVSSQYPLSLGGQYNGTVNQFSSSKRQAFAFIAEYLTDGEVTTLSNIINTFQTTLGRN